MVGFSLMRRVARDWRGRAKRSLVIIVTSLQALLVPAVPVADAVLELRSAASAASPGVHVESQDTRCCHTTHPQDCVLCRLMTACGMPGVPTLVPCAAMRRDERFRSESGFVGARMRVPALPRAPPVG